MAMVGGQPNAGMVAFEANSGKTVWESVGEKNWQGVTMTGWLWAVGMDRISVIVNLLLPGQEPWFPQDGVSSNEPAPPWLAHLPTPATPG